MKATIGAIMTTLPTLFLSHGGGPGFFMKVPRSSPFFEISSESAAFKAMKDVALNRTAYGLPEKPSAIVIVSAHWEERDGYHVYSPEHPTLYYDYYGFPDDTYKLKYPAPGSPALAERVVKLINDANLPEKAMIDSEREGFDHGVFLPLMVLYPEATIPIVQVSLHSSLDPAKHVELGKALAGLRNENVLLVTSGQTTHPMRSESTAQQTDQFKRLLDSVIMNEGLTSEERLLALPTVWKSPLLKQTHNPRSEHITPIAVALGAANGALAKSLLKEDFRFMNGRFSFASYVFGGTKEDAEKCSS
jgi:aromatic ring-opening dioxygenase catalytic subunit (LigB family)